MGLNIFKWLQQHNLINSESADLNFPDLFSGWPKVSLLSFSRIYQESLHTVMVVTRGAYD